MAEAPRQVAIVTGAAGGIGRAVVHLLRARGYAIIAEDISPNVSELAADTDGQVVPLEADVALTESARRAAGLATGRIAEAIVFLSSPAASAITGAILSVDGGYVAR